MIFIGLGQLLDNIMNACYTSAVILLVYYQTSGITITSTKTRRKSND